MLDLLKEIVVCSYSSAQSHEGSSCSVHTRNRSGAVKYLIVLSIVRIDCYRTVIMNDVQDEYVDLVQKFLLITRISY